MTIVIKLLGEEQLPDTKGTLYTVSSGTTAIIKTITYVNIGNTVNVNLYVNSGTSRKIIPNNMILTSGYSMIFDDELTLEAGDLIEGDASIASQVDYTIHGVEEA